MQIFFCKNKCCPTVTVRPGGQIILGDSQGPEGITVWTKQNFADFLEAAKAGKFDHIVAEENVDGLCKCGKKPVAECDISSVCL